MHNSQGIGRRIREERDRLGLNQTAFGATGGVSRRTQAAYEAGHTSPDLGYMAAIAAAGVDVAYVLNGRVSSVGSADEAELLRRYRAASPEIRAAVFAALGAVLAPSEGRGPAVAISGGEQGQVVAGDSKQKRLTINVGGKKRGSRK